LDDSIGGLAASAAATAIVARQISIGTAAPKTIEDQTVN